jgi:hypothetical protein
MGSINVKSAEVLEAEQVEANRMALKTTRDADLKAITHTLTDGSVVQVQPSDLPTLNMAISAGNAEDWVLEDNTVRELTIAEMEECLLSGIAQGKVIWKTYTDGLKNL